jgi:hypothetical protein
MIATQWRHSAVHAAKICAVNLVPLHSGAER